MSNLRHSLVPATRIVEVVHVELVSVTSVNNVGLASIIQGVLEQAGIESVLSGSGAEDAFPPGVIDSLHVLVAHTDAERARTVLDGFETASDPGDEEDTGGDEDDQD
jgi:hypothetical protein